MTIAIIIIIIMLGELAFSKKRTEADPLTVPTLKDISVPYY